MDESFTSYVELHERAWGMDSYPGRPKLEDILSARVVALWHSSTKREPGYRITVYDDIKEVNQHIMDLVLHSKTESPQRRLFRLFIDKEMAKIKGLKVLWGRANPAAE